MSTVWVTELTSLNKLQTGRTLKYNVKIHYEAPCVFFNSPPTSYFLCSSFSSNLIFRYINSQSFYQREQQSFTSIQKWKEWLVYKLLVLIFLIVQAARNSDTSVRLNMYQTTLPIFPVGSHIHTCRCENLKSHITNLPYSVYILLLADRSNRKYFKKKQK